ncbi:MAG: TolC family protein [Thermodesulfobacteriota bacterium]
MKVSAKLFFVLFFVFIILGVVSPLSAEDSRPAPLKLSALIEEALSKNPDILAAKSKWEVLRERPPQAGSLEDPMVGLGIVNLPTDTFSFRQEDMTMKEVSVTQKVPYPGKRPLRSEMAQKEAEAAYSDYEEAKNKISRDMKTAYYELFYINKAIQVTEKNREVLKLLNQIAETKYSVGEGIHTDVFKAQVELSKMIDELIMFSQNKRSLKARINTLLHQPPFATLGEPEELSFEKFSVEPEELVKTAMGRRPLLQSMKRMVERNQAGLRMAERDYYPDFDFKLAYGQRDDGPMGRRADMVTAMVAINLPLWYKTKQDRKVAESQKDIQAAKDQLSAMTNEIRFMIGDKLTEVERAERQLELLKTGIIPLATLSLDSAMASYRVNKVDFITVLDSLMTLFRYEIQYYRLLTDSRKSIAEIEAAVGKSLAEEKKG